MSLSGRLSAFFLTALALVLAGFSLSLYGLARVYLDRQAQEQVQSALDVLTAAAEVEADGVEWDPHQRQLTLGLDDGPDQVRWTIHDGQGRRLQRSPNLGPQDLWTGGGEPADEVVSQQGQPWRIMRRTITAPRVDGAGDLKRPPGKYAVLILTSGICLEPARATLRNLALALAGISLGLWAVSFFLGHWLCRRALTPLSRMAAAARAMTAAERDQRLPVTAHGDELEDLGRAFNDLLARLHEAFERQQRFTGDASHQLRTPLTALLGQIDVALRRERSAQDYRQTLTVVHGRAVQLRQIVDMLLFLARADADARAPCLEALELTTWLSDHLRRWSEHPRARDLRQDNPLTGPVWVEVQPALLGQLVDNLLENACNYSPPDTPIVLGLGCASGTVTLTVADMGSGIAPEHLPHLFEPFYRVPPEHKAVPAGVGLGLAVVQRIAHALGGTVSVHSDPGRGSRFQLHLPHRSETSAPPSLAGRGDRGQAQRALSRKIVGKGEELN